MRANETLRRARTYIRARQQKRSRCRLVTVLACAVVFCTTYALILPAITLEREQILDCSYEVHQHEDDCFDKEGNVICGYADFVVHTHQEEYCYDSQGNLVCTLEEIEVHQHDASCYEEQSVLTCENTDPDHEHTDACYQLKSILICGKAEVIPHTHTDDCYDKDGKLTCGYLQVEEHQHDESCVTTAARSKSAARTAQGSIPEADYSKICDELAETYGIYPGTVEDGVWTVYNAGNADESTIMATVELGGTTTVPEGYYLYIREVGENDDYSPTEDTLKAAIGDKGTYTEAECYAIHWVYIYYDDVNAKWTYSVTPQSVLSGSAYAEVEITYLNGNYLNGEPATHALQIFNSRSDNGTSLEANPTPTGITVYKQGDDAVGYEGFTFTTTRGGPYVFVSKLLDYEGYVSTFEISKTIDGTGPFDDNNEAGKDANDYNRIVRTFDVVKYDLLATLESSNAGDSYNTGTLGFAFTMKKGLTQAAFDISSMTWITDKTRASYQIQYLDADGNVILYQDASGGFHIATGLTPDANGFYTGGASTSINALATDSTGNNGADKIADGTTGEKGENCYQYSAVVSQRLIGTYALTTSEEGGTVVPGTQSLTCCVKVLNDANGNELQPTFRAWLVGNKHNYGYVDVSEENKSNELKVEVPGNTSTAAPVTVTAAPLYNIEMVQSNYTMYKSWFDFSQGNEVSALTYQIGNDTVTGEQIYALLEALGVLEENYGKSNPVNFTVSDDSTDVNGTPFDSDLLLKRELSAYEEIFANIRYGRMYGFGVDLQLANTASSGERGMKGLSLPYGDITFELLTNTTASSGDDRVDPDQYTSLLWDYRENSFSTTSFKYQDGTQMYYGEKQGTSGKLERNLYWDGIERTNYAAEIIPYNNSTTSAANSSYNGGYWTLTEGNTGIDSNGLYQFTVSNYDFNLDSYTFPTQHSNTSVDVARYKAYEYPFSAAYLEILTVFPRTAAGTVNSTLNVYVGNLNVTSVGGYKLTAESYTETNLIDVDNEQNHYKVSGRNNDNELTLAVTEYRPGIATKYNGFNKRTANVISVGNDSLASGYWTDRYYDSSAFVGDQITITGNTYISSASDYHIRAANILQLFDSKALAIDEDLSETAAQKDKITLLIAGAVIPSTGGIADYQFFYAADPDYPKGYDTNDAAVLNYMNNVREEDLLYYSSLADLEAAGYTCIGVLAEVRNCNVLPVNAILLRIPVKVLDEQDNVGQTVAIVNVTRMWTTAGAMSDVSWANGVWNDETNKNTLPGFVSLVKPQEDGSGTGWEVNNGTGSGGFVKAEYESGVLKAGTPKGGRVYGNNLLILGYQAGVKIAIEQTAVDLSGGATANCTISSIHTTLGNVTNSASTATTTLNINVDLTAADESDKAVSDPDVDLRQGTYKIKSLDADGNEVWLDISTNSESPTTVTWPDGSEGTFEFTIYAQTATNNQHVEFVLKQVPVGVDLPDIAFDFSLGSGLSNNDVITATATISGSGDAREYATVNGNISSDTVKAYRLTSTALTKAVSTTLMELDESVTYTIRYSNNSESPLEVAYFYDILPYDNDIRGTHYNDTDEPDDTILTGVDVKSLQMDSDLPTTDFQANVTIYYSTRDDADLYTLLTGFNGDETSTTASSDQEAVEDMLSSTFRLSGETEDDGPVFKVLGTMEKQYNSDNTTTAKYTRVAAKEMDLGYYDDAGAWVWNGTTAEEKAKNEQQYFNLLAGINAIFIKAENMGGLRDIAVELTMSTQRNNAGDLYANIAWAWIPGTNVLHSETVETTVVSREISGAVWYDANLNGAQDTNEKLLSGVTATLFVKQVDGTYTPCTADVTGALITPVQTDENGAYRFSKLAAGDYIVAFSGEALQAYTGVTSYQESGVGTNADNDGVALDALKSSGIDSDTYLYAIRYSTDSDGVTLHSLSYFASANVTLSNSVELYADLDLGLVITGPQLPDTGGAGTLSYTLGGLALMGVAALVLLQKLTGRKKENDYETY